jgi:hypothetical protein
MILTPDFTRVASLGSSDFHPAWENVRKRITDALAQGKTGITFGLEPFSGNSRSREQQKTALHDEILKKIEEEFPDFWHVDFEMWQGPKSTLFRIDWVPRPEALDYRPNEVIPEDFYMASRVSAQDGPIYDEPTWENMKFKIEEGMTRKWDRIHIWMQPLPRNRGQSLKQFQQEIMSRFEQEFPDFHLVGLRVLRRRKPDFTSNFDEYSLAWEPKGEVEWRPDDAMLPEDFYTASRSASSGFEIPLEWRQTPSMTFALISREEAQMIAAAFGMKLHMRGFIIPNPGDFLGVGPKNQLSVLNRGGGGGYYIRFDRRDYERPPVLPKSIDLGKVIPKSHTDEVEWHPESVIPEDFYTASRR